eukprot:4165455-Prymnesium_polylepis.2
MVQALQRPGQEAEAESPSTRWRNQWPREPHLRLDHLDAFGEARVGARAPTQRNAARRGTAARNVAAAPHATR